MSTPGDRAERFFQLHHGAAPLLMPNAWDAGSAKLFASLGFDALATTSSGHAATLGRLDGAVTLDEVVAHAATMAAATDKPLNVDFENAFADDPADAAANIARIVASGAAGCSIEDFTRRGDDPIYELALAAERVAAAAEAAHAGPVRLVLTARAENYLHGRADLADTITRLQAYQAAGADVLYAPGISAASDLRSLVSSVDLPVNVLALPGVPPVAELTEIGVKRVSVGGAFAWAALGAAADAARELLEQGTYGYWDVTARGAAIAKPALGS